MNFKDNLKKIRKDNNLSQEELAEKLNVTRQSVSKWESGVAYPEMDKVIQICKMFNLNIDDLLNKDITEVKEIKESKNTVNKYIEDFLGYITKVTKLFSSLKFKGKVKCIFEQLLLIFIIFILVMIVGGIGSYILDTILSFIPRFTYNFIYNIFEGIYIVVALIFGVLLLSHIFKVRYLDYYEIVEEVEEKEEVKTDKPVLESKSEKVIIRDENHSGYSFIKGIGKCILFMIKFFVLCIIFGLAMALIGLTMATVISFMFIKTGLMFIGILLILLSCIIITIIFIHIFYNFVFNKKNNFKRIFIIMIISLLGIGIGSGLSFIAIKDFTIESEHISKNITIDMKNDLVVGDRYTSVKYIEKDIQNIEIVVNYSKYMDMDIVTDDKTVYFVGGYEESFIDMLKNNIDDINNKKITYYDGYDVEVYASKDNISKLKTNSYDRRHHN